jgi:hypothetical protein
MMPAHDRWLRATHRGLLAMLSVAAAAGSVRAQPRDADLLDVDRKVSYFLERSYIVYAFPQRDLVPHDKTLLFEAQIAPNFFLYQDVARKATDLASTLTATAYSLAITPMVRLRQTNSWSQPVRTPSYMPKVTVQVFFLRQLAKDAARRRRAGVLIAQGVVGHHSNGQDGCLFEGYTAQGTGEGRTCVPDAGTDTQHPAINRVDGSFSTNYVQLGAFYKRVTADQNNEFLKSWGGGMQGEVNPNGAFGIDPQMRDTYGQRRMKVVGELIGERPCVPVVHWCPTGRGRLEASVEHLFGASPLVSSNKISVEAAWARKQSARLFGGYGAMLRYYRGQDYYNLGFLTQVSVVQFGMVIDPGRFGAFPF